MANRRPNHRLVKIHHSYTIPETARLLKVHPNAIRHWIKGGLQLCDERRPFLILGRHLHDFLKARREARRCRCEQGQVYCVRCRKAVVPAGAMADLIPRTAKVADLRAMCPHCETLINRRISMARWRIDCAGLDVKVPEALQHLCRIDGPSVNCDFNPGAKNHGKTQPR